MQQPSTIQTTKEWYQGVQYCVVTLQMFIYLTIKVWHQVVQYCVVTLQVCSYLYNKGMAPNCTVQYGHSSDV